MNPPSPWYGRPPRAPTVGPRAGRAPWPVLRIDPVAMVHRGPSVVVRRRSVLFRSVVSQEDGREQKEKWWFKAEIPRADFSFPRMQREVALRKLDCHGSNANTCSRSTLPWRR